MSTLQNIISQPSLIPFLVSKNVFANNPFKVVDVGARGGEEKHWHLFGNQIKIFGFDADEKETNKLNKLKQNINTTYFPLALWENKGFKKFYITNNLASSTFLLPNKNFLDRFPDRKNLKVNKHIKVKTIDLDTWATENGINNIDFIKLDSEGADLFVLKGARRLLRGSVLGLTSEVSFVQTLVNQPLFGDLNIFLKSYGFEIYDLGLIRLLRKTMSNTGGASRTGQVVGGHALYFKDPVAKFKHKEWSDINILKLACLMELFGLADCAIEIIQVFKSRGFLKNFKSNELLDLLATQVNGKKISYEKYKSNLKILNVYKDIDHQGITRHLNLLHRNIKKILTEFT